MRRESTEVIDQAWRETGLKAETTTKPDQVDLAKDTHIERVNYRGLRRKLMTLVVG